jgi:hypothetical protein
MDSQTESFCRHSMHGVGCPDIPLFIFGYMTFCMSKSDSRSNIKLHLDIPAPSTTEAEDVILHYRSAAHIA